MVRSHVDFCHRSDQNQVNHEVDEVAAIDVAVVIVAIFRVPLSVQYNQFLIYLCPIITLLAGQWTGTDFFSRAAKIAGYFGVPK